MSFSITPFSCRTASRRSRMTALRRWVTASLLQAWSRELRKSSSAWRRVQKSASLYCSATFFSRAGRPVTGMVKPRLPDMLSVFSWRTCSISQEKDGSFHQPDCLAASLLEASFRRALFRSGFMTRPIWRAWFRVTEMCVSTRDASFQEASSAFRSMGAL